MTFWIPPMPPRDDRPAGDKGFVSLRDTFAAAALTGLLSNVQRYQNGPLTEQAFEIAGFMLKERARTSVGVAEMDSATDRKSAATPRACASSCSQPFDSAPTTHDAVPEAKARDADRGRTDKAVARPGDGTGNTPSEAEIDALEFVVEEGRTASVDDYGILRSWLIRLRPEWENQSYEESDEKRTNTTMSRVEDEIAIEAAWDRTGLNPTWPDDEAGCGVKYSNAMADEIARLREAIHRLADQDATLSVQGGNVMVTMDATLTDEEREALSLAYSRLTADSKYDKVTETLRNLLGRIK